MVLDELDDPRTPRICMLAASLSNDVLEERELSRYVVQEMNTFSQAFIRRLEAARDSGELPENFEVKVAVDVAVTYLQGLFRTIRVLHSRQDMELQIETLLRGLGL
jgi:TetR/AcrR family transcriptional repressor of nem operon